MFELKEESQVARDFEPFLARNFEERPPNPAQIDTTVRDAMIEYLRTSQSLHAVGNAKETLFQRLPQDESAVIENAVRMAIGFNHGKQQMNPTFFRLLPQELDRAALLAALHKKLSRGDFQTREARVSEKYGTPEIIGDVEVEVDGRKYQFRFGVNAPREGGALPSLSLLLPLITPQTQNRIIGVFKMPYSDDHLVITKWDKGRPSKGAIVKGKDVAIVESISVDFHGIASREISIRFLSEFYSRSQLDSRHIGTFDISEFPILTHFEKTSELFVIPPVEQYFAPISPIGYRRGTSFEHGYALKASNGLHTAPPDMFLPQFYFPAHITQSRVIDAITLALKEKQFELLPKKRTQRDDHLRCVANLNFDGEIYSVEFILSPPKNNLGKVALTSVKIRHTPTMSNHAVGVYWDKYLHEFLVITSWKNGEPEQGVIIPE